MTDFGKWLGEMNGMQMLADVAKEDCTKEQFRAAITTYCILFEINVDTKAWDDLMRDMYEYYNSWFDSFDEFDMFMCDLLV